MGYHVIDPDEIEPMPNRPSEARSVSDAIGMENMGLRIYDVAPGENIPVSGLHYHDEQEEAFYVSKGAVRVETPDEEYAVEEGCFFVAEPKSAHRAYNTEDAGENAVVVAMGAPSVNDAHVYEG